MAISRKGKDIYRKDENKKQPSHTRIISVGKIKDVL